VVYAACFAAQALLKQFAVLADVVQDARKSGFVLRMERFCESGSQFSNAMQVLT